MFRNVSLKFEYHGTLVMICVASIKSSTPLFFAFLIEGKEEDWWEKNVYLVKLTFIGIPHTHTHIKL